jgi:predicted nucleotidyltransferase
MKNSIINRKVIKKVAIALKELNESVVYVGGAVVSLYINDPAADDIRPTKDIDISLEIASLADLEKLRVELTQKGFVQSAEENTVCRFKYDDVLVDVMGTKPVGWAPGDIWFERGFPYKQKTEIEGIGIYILPLPHYLAAKFSAYHDRGNIDPRTSHDFEDITYVLDNQTNLVEIIASSQDDVKEFLKAEFKEILKNEALQEAMLAHLFYETQTARFERIISTLNEISS